MAVFVGFLESFRETCTFERTAMNNLKSIFKMGRCVCVGGGGPMAPIVQTELHEDVCSENWFHSLTLVRNLKKKKKKHHLTFQNSGFFSEGH